MGITGAGEVIGVADTGLDLQSCYFSTASGPRPPASSSFFGTVASPNYDLTQPKVVQYITFQDAFDVAAGHGKYNIIL